MLPRPRLLFAEVRVEVAVPVPMFKSPPEKERSPEDRMLPMTESTSFGPTVPRPRRLFALSQKKLALFWRMSEPSEKRTEPAVNSGVLMEPPDSVSPCDDASPVVESPPLHVLVAVLVLVSEPPDIKTPLEADNEVKESPPEKVEVAVARESIAPDEAVMVRPLLVESPFVRTPPAKVEVAFVPVPCASIVPPNTDEVAPPVPVTYRLPAMPSVADGVVEPMPTFPFASIRKAVLVAVAVEVEIRKRGVVASERASSERSPAGVVVPPSPV